MIKTHVSFFSGIGGAEIAASWMGWDNVFHCEIQEFPRKVLEYWYPNAVSYEDITKTDFTSWRGKIDILTGGFPCQAFSMAGKRLGDKDHRYLWPEMLRAIREIQPSWVVGENVTGLLSMVQSGEEAKMGRTDDLFEANYIYRKEQRFTLDEICEGLEREGYAVQPFVIPACAVGAPHRRDRVWIVARLAADTGCDRQRHGQGEQEPIVECERTSDDRNGCKNGLVADTKRCGRREIHDEVQSRQPNGQRAYGNGDEQHAPDPHSKLSQCGDYSEQEGRDIKRKRVEPPHSPTGWADFPTQSPVCRGDDGISARLAGITFPRWRAEAIKALGNAMCPQVVYEIFRAIEENYE